MWDNVKMDRFAATILLLMVLVPGMALGDGADMYQLGADAANYAMAELGFETGDADVLVLTNAGYPVIDGQTTDMCLDALVEITGCSRGKENLVNTQSPPWNPLWFGFFNKNTGEAVYMTANADASGFDVQVKDKIDAETVFANVETWDPGVFGHMLPIANVWAHENTPYIFMKAVQLHDHICPGISSGFLLARYVEKELPIEDPANQSYKVISCPNWCKDDYFQVAWDCTPGKSGLFVKKLTAAETSALKAKYSTTESDTSYPFVAGMFIRWDASSNSGDGLVLAFDIDKGFDMSNVDIWPSWASRLKMDVLLMDAADTPENFVSTIKEFHLDNNDELVALQAAGVNPLKVLGVET
jgi:formylmethanofuran dehydrogenase subunit E-like metal-binding protein